MKQNKTKAKRSDLKVAIEIQASELSLLVAEPRDQALAVVGSHRMRWVQESKSLDSDEGLRELTAAISTLAAKEKLAGVAANVLLSSDLCVTRVVAGPTESVKPELRNLQERSRRYLLLGAGPKVMAESTRAIDAKHSQTWLTVTNETTLDYVVQAVEQAGMQVALIEHSLVALCRAVGQLGHDAQQPVIMIDLTEGGVDLGVSFRGQLLFDYRPGGLASKNHIAEIVNRHLERIQRYCNREFRNVSGTISDVYLNGPPDEVRQVQQHFEGSPLRANVLEPNGLCPASDLPPELPVETDCRLVAPLGSLLVEQQQRQLPPGERGLPDLMDAYRSGWKEPLVPALVKSAWPIAASLALALGIQMLAMFEQGKAARLEARHATMSEELNRVSRLALETEAATSKIRYLQEIGQATENRPYHLVIAAIGQCMPEGVWLEDLAVHDDGNVLIRGPGYSEDLIFEFVDELKKVPFLAGVSLQGQQPIQWNSQPAVRFDIKCRYTGRTNLVERTASK